MKQQMLTLPITEIVRNPGQPRRNFKKSSLEELAQSLKEHGLIQPVTVEPTDDGLWMLVDGERRFRAAKLAGMTTLIAVVRERTNHNGRERLLSGIIANVQREDMNPIDEAEAYQSLVKECGMSVNEISQQIGKSVVYVYKCLTRLSLTTKVIELMRDQKLSSDSRLVDALKVLPADLQIGLAERAILNDLTIKSVLVAAKKLKESLDAAPIKKNAQGKSPAMQMARKNYAPYMREADDVLPPPRWNALRQAGKAPAWEIVVDAVNAMCANCTLRSMASESTCRDCPGVDLLGNLAKAAKA